MGQQERLGAEVGVVQMVLEASGMLPGGGGYGGSSGEEEEEVGSSWKSTSFWVPF